MGDRSTIEAETLDDLMQYAMQEQINQITLLSPGHFALFMDMGDGRVVHAHAKAFSRAHWTPQPTSQQALDHDVCHWRLANMIYDPL